MKIIVTPTDAYLSGSATGLTTIMGLTAAEQKKVGTRSVVMKAGTSPYTSFHSNLTTAVLSGILPVAKGTKYKTSSESEGLPAHVEDRGLEQRGGDEERLDDLIGFDDPAHQRGHHWYDRRGNDDLFQVG